MNKKFLSAILFGALVASAGSFVSCADNDSDIAALQDQNSELKAQLASLKTQLQAELKSAASEAAVAAVEAKLSTLDAATPENMAATLAALTGKFDTAEAKLIALETQIKALEGLQNVDVNELLSVLEKAKDNAGSADIEALSALVDALDAQVNTMVSELRSIVFQPQFYVDGIEAVEYTYLKYIALDPKGDKYTSPMPYSNEVSSDNEEAAPGGTSATNYDPRHSVYSIDPKFVWAYAHVGDLTWPEEEHTTSSIGNPGWCQWYATLSNCPDDKCMYMNDEWGQYVALPNGVHDYVGEKIMNEMYFVINPANAAVSYDQLTVAVKNVCAMTRATADVTVVSTVKENGGLLRVNYYISNPKDIITANNDESYSALNKKENTTIFKLQFNDSDKDGVESDWAALYETSIQPVAIALNKYAAAGHEGYGAWYAPINCAAALPNELHKNPFEAAADEKRTTEIDYLSSGVDIAKHIELHFIKRDNEKADRQHKNEQNLDNSNNNTPEKQHPHVTMSLEEAAYRYGFTYEFNLVPYVVDDNETNNSSYAHLKTGLYENSILVPNTVDEERAAVDGDKYAYIPKKATADSKASKDGYEQGASSVDKEPLVQVLVKKGDDVILDGYVSFIITRQVQNVLAPVFDLGSKDKGCAAITYKSTYNQYSELLLEQTAQMGLGMSKLEFEEGYELVTYKDGNYPDAAVQFAVKVAEDGKTVLEANPLPVAKTYANVYQEFDPNGITNNTLYLSLDKFDQQYVYEKENRSDIIYVMYSRRGTASHSASLHGILVPLKVALNEVKGLEYSLKNVNFWYSNDGAPETQIDEAFRMNVNYAVDKGNTITNENGTNNETDTFVDEDGVDIFTEGFVRDLNDAWDGKALKFNQAGVYTKGEKPVYYFHPYTKNVVVTDEYSGTKYQLDVDNDDLYCAIWVDGDDPVEATFTSHKHELSKAVSKEAADFVKNAEFAHQVNTKLGIYTNTHLYALVGDETKSEENCIAEMNRYTGEVWYKHTKRAQEVLNATGHRVAEEKAIIGIFLPNACDMAYGINYDAIPNNMFPAYFLRPLDMQQSEPSQVIDAVNNASYISIFDKYNFQDWRDYAIVDKSKTPMDYSNVWLLAFYGVNKMTLHLDAVKTNMNGHDIKTTLLKDVNSDIKISYVEHDKSTVIAEFPTVGSKTLTLSAYNKESMGVKSTYDALVNHFGLIKYENKGANVSTFDFVVPVTLGYDWGELTTSFTVHVVGTEGNRDNE